VARHSRRFRCWWNEVNGCWRRQHVALRTWRLDQSFSPGTLRAGMSVRTAHSYDTTWRAGERQPRTYRSRPDPFGEDWSWVAGELERDPALQSQTLFRLRCERQPGRYQEDQLAHCRVVRSVRTKPRSDVPTDPSARRSGAVRFHIHEQPERHVGRSADPSRRVSGEGSSCHSARYAFAASRAGNSGAWSIAWVYAWSVHSPPDRTRLS
jgi:hypothetical protein